MSRFFASLRMTGIKSALDSDPNTANRGGAVTAQDSVVTMLRENFGQICRQTIRRAFLGTLIATMIGVAGLSIWLLRPTSLNEYLKGRLGAGWSSTEFMGVHATGSKFVYVIDHSGSMSQGGRLGTVKRELLASLADLSPESQFQIIFYNLHPEAVLQPKVLKMHFATDDAKLLAGREIEKIVADGGTEHLPALKVALGMQPDVIFFLTDADDLEQHDVREAIELNKGRANMHTIEFALGPETDRQNMLRNLAAANAGTYRYIEVTKMGRNSQSNGFRVPRAR